jgi:hypothetical protein
VMPARSNFNTLTDMTQHLSVPWSWRSSASCIGLVVGAVGIMMQFFASPELFGKFPPGIYFLAGALALVLMSRRWLWAPVFAVLLAAWITFGGIRGGQLAKNLGAANGLLVTGAIVLQVGLLLAIISGVLAILHNVRHVKARKRQAVSRAARP